MPAKKAPAKKSAKAKSPIVALYAVPIHLCIKRGNLAEMKTMAAQARKHISDVSAALAALETKIGLKKR